MSKITLKFTVVSDATQIPMGFSARFNGQTFFDQRIDSEHQCEYSFEDVDSAQHVLELELKNKTALHTQIDSAGNIVKDYVIEIKNIEFGGINVDQLFYDKSVYSHSFNGSQPLQEHKFYGTMGCNGVVRFEFQTPFYLWLLENI